MRRIIVIKVIAHDVAVCTIVRAKHQRDLHLERVGVYLRRTSLYTIPKILILSSIAAEPPRGTA